MGRHTTDRDVSASRAQGAPMRAASATAGASTSTAAANGATRGRANGVESLFVGVSEAQRLQLELIARRAPDRSAALAQVIDLVVGGSAAKRAAIVRAISENAVLDEQWHRAWQQLRG